MTSSARFWDKIAPKYVAAPVRDTDAYAHTLDRTRAYLHQNDHVIELGCGSGTTAATLAPHVGHYLATDVSPKMIEYAQERAMNGPSWLEPAVMPADLPGIAPASADVVLAFSLLHLVPDRGGVLRRVHEVLKPGGYFISKTVCLGGPGALLFGPLIGAMRLFGKAPPVSLITGDALEVEMAGAGFEIVEAGDHNRKPACRFVVARKAG